MVLCPKMETVFTGRRPDRKKRLKNKLLYVLSICFGKKENGFARRILSLSLHVRV